MPVPISLQLYTVRDQTALDFARTVKEVAKMGYQAVEIAGFGNLKTVQEVKKALDDAGLKVSGAHCGIKRLETEPNAALDEARLLGHNLIIIPWLDEAQRNSATAWKNMAGTMSAIGQQITPQGFDLAYHNHDFEFQTFDGQSGFDILWNNTEPSVLKSELDVYWVQRGGGDPVAWINKLGMRLRALHIKDMAAGPEKRFAEVGSGILDFKAIFAAGQRLGVQNYVVEQDSCYGKPTLEAARTSIENLKNLGLA